MESRYLADLRAPFQDGFADDASAFAEEYAEFFQASLVGLPGTLRPTNV